MHDKASNPITGTSDLIDPREQRLCHALDRSGSGMVLPADFKRAITSKGLRTDDARLKESMERLTAYSDDTPISFDQLRLIIRPNILLLERVLQGNVVIPDFSDFCDSLKHIFDEVAVN